MICCEAFDFKIDAVTWQQYFNLCCSFTPTNNQLIICIRAVGVYCARTFMLLCFTTYHVISSYFMRLSRDRVYLFVRTAGRASRSVAQSSRKPRESVQRGDGWNGSGQTLVLSLCCVEDAQIRISILTEGTNYLQYMQSYIIYLDNYHVYIVVQTFDKSSIS